MSDPGLTTTCQDGSSKGAAEYLYYQKQIIYEKIDKRVLELDFVEERFHEGQKEPLNLLGYSIKKKPRLPHYQRMEK